MFKKIAHIDIDINIDIAILCFPFLVEDNICGIIEDPFECLRQKLTIIYNLRDQLKDAARRHHGKTMFFSRHGESEYNLLDKIGGDSPLSDRGSLYAKALGRYFNTLGKK